MDLEIENSYAPKIVAGIDEVGRGPLAGPVVACAFIAKAKLIPSVNDSKKISKKLREELYNILTLENTYAIGQASAQEIDEINILNATKLAMKRAVDALKAKPDIVLVDGNMKFEDERFVSIIKGDSKIYSIAASSIIAKVYRDNLMQKISQEFPEYYFEKNSGYGTKQHIDAIRQHGLTNYHRKSFTKNYKSFYI